MRLLPLRVVTTAVALLMSCQVLAGERLVLATGMREPWTTAAHDGFHDRVVKELFRRIGIDAQVTYNPASARNIHTADDGADDGLVGRVAGLEETYPNLVRVPEPLFHNDFVAATLRDARPRIAGWDDLKARSVAYILGWVVFDRNLPKTRELTVAKDHDQLYSLLAAGRAEVVLHERMQAMWMARGKGIDIRIHEPPLVRTPMFIYLHRRHAELVPRVSAALAAMKADGAWGAIWQGAFAGLEPSR